MLCLLCRVWHKEDYMIMIDFDNVVDLDKGMLCKAH